MSVAKPVQVVGQGQRRPAQPQGQPVDLRDTVLDHALLQRQRYLSLVEAAAYLRFPSPEAFWAWAKRQGLRPCKAGRANLYLREDLERRVEQTRGESGQGTHAAERTRPRLINRTHRSGSAVRS